MNKKILFNDKWEFFKGNLETKYNNRLCFEKVDIPHDWLIYNSINLYENSIGLYRKKLIYSKNEEEVLLCFDGVYMDSTLYVNNKLIGEWKYGYSSFEYDITNALIDGENEIILRVVHKSPNSRWYSGAGIYRNVWLKTRDKNHIETNGIYVCIRKEKESWNVEISTELKLYENARLYHSIIYNDEVIATSSEEVKFGEKINVQNIVIKEPLLWDVDNPVLYKLVTELKLIDGDSLTKIEHISQNIGFKEVIMDSHKGLILNGRKIKLFGVCEHHDLGALGSALNKEALRRRFKILKDMGVNSIRTSHNMPDPQLMDLADEMGFLINSEAFDMWERSKTAYDYARFFKEWAYKDVKSWITRDRNHPSLLMWSIGNEIYDTHADVRGQEVTKMLMKYVREFDPNENGKVTIGSNYMPWENAQKCADIVKLAGYNYSEKYYEEHHEKHKDWIIYGSETSSVVQSRGIYHFPFEKSILADDDEQCSVLGNSTTSWGAKCPERCITDDRDAEFSLGQFIWTGFDYIGEPTPYHTKNSYFGQIDTATFKKDSYYIYQAEWTDYKKKPMIHIFPYWDFNENQIIDVRVCSNAPKIELQFNGEVIGKYNIDHKKGKDLVGWWKIPYKPGELKAIAYDENNRVIAVDIKKSFKDAKTIVLNPNKEKIKANGKDLIFMEITMKDEDGNIVENANNRVKVSVSGSGRLIGLDNGDSSDYDEYKGLSRRLFSGKLMAIIGSTLEEGYINIEVSSTGLESTSIQLISISENNEDIKGICASTKNKEMEVVMGSVDEIPVRKIEIISEYGQELDMNNKEIIVKAHLHPENASYRELNWSAVNESGIVSNIAMVESFGDYAKVTALGDGEFRIRCTSNNGTDKVKLISQLEFKVSGLGTVFKNPYEFVSGGLFDHDVTGNIGNGNEKGLCSDPRNETRVGFFDIDFGSYGSDTITVSFFTLNDQKYDFQVWEGIPEGKNSTLVGEFVYQKKSIWNVYQEETYKLNKRLKGVTLIYFVFYNKVHMKGFIFEKKNKAFEKIMAVECNHIYGDTFLMKEDKIEKIGNNVSLIFEDMDFKNEGVSKLIICGNSPIDKNTINVQFSDDKNTTKQIVEFSHTQGYEEIVFDLEKIIGIKNVTFIFLPGCNFDFSWFKFEV